MFLAHKSQLKDGNYIVLDQYNKQKVLINHKGYKLVSNICTHQNSLISTENGEGMRVCPYHSWSFDLDGNPIGSGRTSYYCKNTEKLQSENVYEWNSLLFSKEIKFDISQDFSNLILMEQRVDIVKSDYKIIMDLFLDVDHIQGVHTGVYDQIGITDTNVSWNYTKEGSYQTVKQGAYWIAVYPNIMIEWQKGSLFITMAMKNNEYSKVFVYKYMDKNHSDLWDLNQKVWETAWMQDKSQAELITKFPESNIEPQKIHYRDFLKSNGTY